MRTRFSLTILVALLLLGLLLPLSSNGLLQAPDALPSPAAPTAAPQAPSGPTVAAPEQSGPQLREENARLQAVHTGKWPAQAAAWRGDIRPDQHGPQRNDPAGGIPVHAYSPFDERRNREYPCPPGGCDFQPGQVLVKLAPEVEAQPLSAQAAEGLTADAALNRTLAALGVINLEPIFPNAESPGPQAQIANPDGDLIPEPDLTRWYRAKLQSQEADVYAMVQALEDAPGIAWAEPDYLRKPVGEPIQTDPAPLPRQDNADLPASLRPSLPASLPSFNDPLYAQQWHLLAVKAPEAWQWLSDHGLPPGGNRDIVVAVIDTGVDLTHPDLAANLWTNSREIAGNNIDDDGNGIRDDVHGANFVGTQSGNPMDDHGHGTHVAGIIAAQASNGIGGVGVAYNVQVMPIKAAQYSGVLASSDIAEAIYYAVAQGADVINMSFGGYARSQVEEDALAVAFGTSVLVAAAGNDARPNLPCDDPRALDMYPGAYNWVLGIMARQRYPDAQGDFLAGFSNFDCTPQDTHEYEMMAPGVDIWSTLPNSQYAAWDGTSMAAPVVAGLAALARTKWADKDLYSSRFIMGQLATTGGLLQAYTTANSNPVSFHVPSGLASLTAAPNPSLAYLQHWTFDGAGLNSNNDDDGILDAGETVELAIVVKNHWGKADPVTVTLEPWAPGATQPDPYVTMLVETVDYGAVGPFSTDDNGLLYDNDLVVGVAHPFRFQISPSTPNDHVISFRMTMAAGNGYDPGDPAAPYTSVSRFFLMVQRGRELPPIITDDVTMTSEDFWIIPDQTRIQSGVDVTVTEGTQYQFWPSAPNDPYSLAPNAYLDVLGKLTIEGSSTHPVEAFAALNRTDVTVRIQGQNVNVSYFRVDKPQLTLSSIDHCYTTASTARQVNNYDIKLTASGSIDKCMFHEMRGLAEDFGRWFKVSAGSLTTSLFDRGHIGWRSYNSSGQPKLLSNLMPAVSRYNTFLNNKAMSSYGAELLSTISFPPLAQGQNTVVGNAFLNPWIDGNSRSWLWVAPADDLVPDLHIESNYWASQSDVLIGKAIYDSNDNFEYSTVHYQPVLATPDPLAYPFVVSVRVSTGSIPDASEVGAELVMFTITFNRDMDATIQPAVSFGPAAPYTDFTVHGGWQDARTWVGTFNVTPITGDGYQLIRVAGAVAADDPWLVTGDDAGRFRFEIITSGTESMNLQATGGEGYVDLSWMQDDFDLLAGYNLYRSTNESGTYARINPSLIPIQTRAWRDTNVTPGVPYFYKFTVVKSDMSESDYSNTTTAAPLDTIPPSLAHTAIADAQPGLPLTLFADATDNVAVQTVTLFYRSNGAPTYASKSMVKTSGNRYAATLEGSLLAPPGVDYYIEAWDGVSTTRSGRPEYPHHVAVSDRPVVTSVSPNQGPTTGGTAVTIAGANFKAGAAVALGGTPCAGVTVVSSSQINCLTPAHFPAAADVTVTNPGGASGTLLRGFTFLSTTASLSLPNTGGGQNALVQVPVNAANVQGLTAASLKLTFNSAVLRPSAAAPGSLTPGWGLSANTTVSGEVRLALASNGGAVTEAGVLAVITFEVIGNPGQSTALTLTSVLLNDGAIPVETAAGSFQVDQIYSVGGTVRFWNGGQGVPGVALALEGARLYSTSTTGNGSYTVGGAAAGSYTLTPEKSTDANGITAYDASLALQHDVGLITLNGNAASAGDVNKSGAITSMDAFYILQKSVDLIALPFPGAGVVWSFSPATRTYSNLAANQSSQDFTAILLGDISGNWVAPGGLAQEASETGPWLAARWDAPAPDGARTAHLVLFSAGRTSYSLDLDLRYDPKTLTLLAADAGAATAGSLFTAHQGTPGQLRIALAQGLPLADDPVSGSEVAVLRFQPGDANAASTLTLAAGRINEDASLRWQAEPSPRFLIHLPLLNR